MNDKPIPFFKRFVIQNFPFIEEDFDALTNYQLFCKVVEYLNKVIGSQNEVTEQMEYVLNYFNNLDVQDEINNKLDQMAESGELTDLIAGYLNLRGILAYDTVADMKAADNLVDGSFAETYGFYAKGDGGGAKYKIRAVTNADTVDEAKIIALADENLVAELMIDESWNVKQFGVKADGETDNYAKLTTIIGYNPKTLYFPDGQYVVSQPINITPVTLLHGQSVRGTIIIANNGFLTWTDTNVHNLAEFYVHGDSTASPLSGSCIKGDMQSSTWENVRIRYYNIAWEASNHSWINRFDGCEIRNCNYVMFSDNVDNFNNNNFYSCNFQQIGTACFKISGEQNTFYGCNFESSATLFMYTGHLLTLDSCYIEGNDNIINITSSSTTSSVVIANSWLNSKSSATGITGWIAKFPTVSNVNSQTASLVVHDCEIVDKTTDMKPFAFNGENTNSYWGVSLENNIYTGNLSNGIIYYADLFDISVATSYLRSTSNPITFYTDLPLTTESGITWFRKSLGNKRGALKTNQCFVIKGNYAVERTSGQITISPTLRIAGVYPQINNIPVLVRFTDNTFDYARMSIDANNIYVTPTYNGRTTAEIIFDNEYNYQYHV